MINMEQITLGQIALAVGFLTSLITGIGYLHKKLRESIVKLFKDQLDSIDDRFKDLNKRINSVDLESCKNFLVRFLSDVDQGREIDEIEFERFWEQYEHYTKAGGNSYIKQKVEKLKAENKL